MITVRRYGEDDEPALFALLEKEGEEWKSYWGAENRDRYREALGSCIVYAAFEGGVLCGYCRCRDDNGYGIYVYDLLVDQKHRGRRIGRRLMEQVRADFPDDTVYVMSDVDEYYEKQGYPRIGSVFEVRM